jgi:CBS domain-containing protein
MVPSVYRCAPEATVGECAQLMRDQELGFVPVLDHHGSVVGVVTDRDLTVRVLAEHLPPSTKVACVMTPGPFLTCQPEESVRSLEERMGKTKRSRALVQDRSGTLLGIISLSDIARAEPSEQRTGQLLRAVTARESTEAARR